MRFCNLKKKIWGKPGIEPGTSWFGINCSTTELQSQVSPYFFFKSQTVYLKNNSSDSTSFNKKNRVTEGLTGHGSNSGATKLRFWTSGEFWFKKILGDTRVWTRDLSICSRMLYHWAISPLVASSILRRYELTLEIFYKSRWLLSSVIESPIHKVIK